MKFREQAYAYPLHHVTVKQMVKLKSGITLSYIILYIKPIGSETVILFEELLAYFKMYSGDSLSWERQTARAVGLFYDYCVVKAPIYNNDNNVVDTIRGFIECSISGDPDLGWVPSKIRTIRRYVSYIMEFSRYLEIDCILPKPTSKIHIEYFYRAFAVKENSSLSHIIDVDSVSKTLQAKSSDHIFKFPKHANTTYVKIHQFPEELIEPLLNEGFKLKNGEENIGAKILTILMLFGGMRNSEPFHLWFNDINIFPKSGNLEILLHHPSDSNCNIPPYRKKIRSIYLLERKMLPRNHKNNPHNYYAGWKNLALDNNLTTEIKIIHDDVESLFIDLYKKYMRQREICIRAYKTKNGHDHPFFFVKTGDPDDLGAPLSMSSYIKSLKAASLRLSNLGYDSSYGADNGISPHAMRHWFASILTEVGVDPKVMQSLMNHRSILSQEVYKSSNKRMIDTALSDITHAYIIKLKNG